ncbi:MAG: NPCBM/NEW2 domain-containing protein, partial [Lachnospiraceae bacterium]|nr:NPCBM/NEW2 domain-containing protein [Lachnospiraceae bacterium]
MQRTKSQLIRNALFLLISIGIFGFIGNIAKADTTHYLRPYQAYRMTTYDGNAEKSFTMMGVKYIHGLKTENYYNTSYADFNLGGQMNTVSFVVGHIDGDSDGEGTMKLYLDGEIQEAYTRALQNNMVNQTVTLNVTGKQQLVIVIEGNHAKYGIGNITETGAHNYDCTISK